VTRKPSPEPTPPRSKPARRVINKRFRADLLDHLGVLAANWKPPTSTTLLMELACAQFLQCHEHKEMTR
jgi:hypothetical protein